MFDLGCVRVLNEKAHVFLFHFKLILFPYLSTFSRSCVKLAFKPMYTAPFLVGHAVGILKKIKLMHAAFLFLTCKITSESTSYCFAKYVYEVRQSIYFLVLLFHYSNTPV